MNNIFGPIIFSIACIFLIFVSSCVAISWLWNWCIKNSEPVNDAPYDDLFKTPEIEYSHKDGRI